MAYLNQLEYLSQFDFKKTILEPVKMMASFSLHDHVYMLISNIHYLVVSFISFLFFYIIYTFGFFLILNKKNDYLDFRIYIFIILFVTSTSFPLFGLGLWKMVLFSIYSFDDIINLYL